MTGQDNSTQSAGAQKAGIAGKAIDMVENAGSSVGDAIGDDHVVVRKTKKIWQYFLLYPAVFGALLGAIPTGLDLYKSFKYGIKVSDVDHAEEQRRLWIRNFGCVRDLSYHTVRTDDGSTVQIGACTNGDVLIEVIPRNGGDKVAEWVSINRITESGTASISPLSILVSTAFAAEVKAVKGGAAQGKAAKVIENGVSKGETVCTSLDAKKGTIERIIKRDDICTREITNMMTRKSEKPETVPCETKCQPDVK